jgi:hypothetical protein
MQVQIWYPSNRTLSFHYFSHNFFDKFLRELLMCHLYISDNITEDLRCLVRGIHLVISYDKMKGMFSLTDPVLQFLLSGLQQSQVATAAANSLQNISSQCRSHMANHLYGLLQIVQAVDTFSVSDDAAIGLLKGEYRRKEGQVLLKFQRSVIGQQAKYN